MPLRVEPRANASLLLAFDPSHEPEFRGGLKIDYRGRDLNGCSVLQGVVRLNVASEH
jgi:hypothetical protein